MFFGSEEPEKPRGKAKAVIHQEDERERDVPAFYDEKSAVARREREQNKAQQEKNMNEGPSFVDRMLARQNDPQRRTSNPKDSLNLFSWDEGGAPPVQDSGRRGRRSLNSIANTRTTSINDDAQRNRDAEAEKFSEAKGSKFLQMGDANKNKRRFSGPTNHRMEMPEDEASFFDKMSPNSEAPKGKRRVPPQGGAQPSEGYDSGAGRRLSGGGVPHIPRKRIASQVFPEGADAATEEEYETHVDDNNQLQFSNVNQMPNNNSHPEKRNNQGAAPSTPSRLHAADRNAESVEAAVAPAVRRGSRPQQRSSLSFGAAGLGSYA